MSAHGLVTTTARLSPRGCPAPQATLTAGAIALILSACSDQSTGTSATALADTHHGPEVIFGFDSGGGLPPDSLSPDTAVDVERPGVCDFPAAPAPGEPGAACEAPKECDSGFCLDGPDGKRCSRTCTDCCPKGWACEQAPGNDTVFVCVPKLKALCRPCTTDAFCDGLAAGALCLAIGDGAQGRVCGGACVEDADCPSAYACQAATGEKGTSKQCVRVSGACGCSPAAIAAGDATTCSVATEAGTCHGTRTCAADGLGACSAATPAAETCNGQDDDCDGATDEDLSGTSCDVTNEHGTCGGQTTCDGVSAGCSAATPAAEVCNGQDDDCDGSSDEGLAGQPCSSANEHGSCAGTTTCDGSSAGCTAPAAAAEVCNGQDDDCDGQTDEGSPDTDADGKADCVDVDDDADGTPDGADCAPLDMAISPSATEACNSKDDDCDGQTDEAGAAGCSAFYADVDADGAGDAASSACLCAATSAFPVAVAGDCNDNDTSAHPKASEACNGKDDDCDASTDEQDASGCTKLYHDGDGDTFGDANQFKCLCSAQPPYAASQAGDCHDGDPAISPNAGEACNGKDDDCDSTTDEPNALGCKAYYEDADKDGLGKPATGQCLCAASSTHTASASGDCDDSDPNVSPKVKEACNGKDDDCSGGTDEADALGCTTYWADTDQDSYGKPSDTMCLCKPASPYTAQKAGDCDDSKASISPAGKESCNSKDDDCDGDTDPAGTAGCSNYFVDEDKDSFGDSFAPTKCLCAPSAPHAALKGGDCNDKDSGVNLSAAEACNSKDDNCNGLTDEPNALQCTNFYVDGDKDGYGVSGVQQCLCKAQTPYSAALAGDCNDAVPTISPEGKEVCNDKDDDCNGLTDDNASGMKTLYLDKDGDGWGVAGASKLLCGASGDYKASNSGDCQDGDPAIHPAASEIQCNGKDDDCKGGDSCAQQCTGVCGGKCASSLPAGTLTICTLEFLGLCLEYTTVSCYCDSACTALGDCCPGRSTCCK